MLAERLSTAYRVLRASELAPEDRGLESTGIELESFVADWLASVRLSSREHELTELVLALDGYLPWGVGHPDASIVGLLEERLRRAFDRGELRAIRCKPGLEE